MMSKRGRKEGVFTERWFLYIRRGLLEIKGVPKGIIISDVKGNNLKGLSVEQ